MTNLNPFLSLDPMTTWTKLMAESVARVHAFADTCAASWAQMSQDAIAYSGQLSAEARKLSLDAWKKLGVAA